MENVSIQVLKGDVTERNTDAIVNPINTMLILGSGLSGAIKAKGGEEIAGECARHGPSPIGSAVLTTGGKLKTRHIIHAVLCEYDGRITEQHLADALLASLRLANRMKLRSIALPHMDLGISPLPVERTARALFSVIRDFADRENRTLELLEVVLQDIELLRVYKDAYHHILG
jgi:O-acetyl-ADP-ribose deacetylase (regulator of RNase III)